MAIFWLWSSVILSAASAWFTEDCPLVVNVSGGSVRGVFQGGYRIFRGIPYAAPPLGDLRWRPPQPHPGWEVEMDASNFGPSCLTLYHWPSVNLSRTGMSEDCLTINVVTPRGRGRFPVMVYLHAGEFITGSSNDAESDFPYFASDIVLVTPNSRLSAFGYLADDALRTRDPKGGTGNYGVLDQRFALEWVQANIEAFGGDSRNVAIAGESSGGTEVIFHLTAFGGQATKLFNKAILESPGITQVKNWQDATLNADYIVSALTAKGSRNCVRTPGYAPFNDTSLVPGSKHAMVRITSNDTVDTAMHWCDSNVTCKGFVWDAASQETTFVGVASNSSWYVRKTVGRIVFLQRGPVDPVGRTQCLLSADPVLLTQTSWQVPRGDTVFVDHYGPTIDGVHLNESLVSKVAKGALADGVHVLVGSNLDEGTEFMSYAPPILCNATSSDLEAWADAFYGAELGSSVPRLYTSLQRPLPSCIRGLHEPISGENAIPYMVAMRSAGEIAFRCPTQHLARVARGRAYVYQFALTPKYSENMGDTQVAGAFHGAEVPFVFGYPWELRTAAETKLSKIIGCYWRSFLWHGDPSKEDCGTAVWPQFNGSGNPYLELNSEVSVRSVDPDLESRCALFNSWLQQRTLNSVLQPQLGDASSSVHTELLI